MQKRIILIIRCKIQLDIYFMSMLGCNIICIRNLVQLTWFTTDRQLAIYDQKFEKSGGLRFDSSPPRNGSEESETNFVIKYRYPLIRKMIALKIPEKLARVKQYINSKEVSTAKICYKYNFIWEGFMYQCIVRFNSLTKYPWITEDVAKEAIIKHDSSYIQT